MSLQECKCCHFVLRQLFPCAVMLSQNVVGVVVVFAIISGCTSQPDWIQMGINSYTSGRIMLGAANYIGLRLVRELYFYQKRDGALYRATFIGRRSFGMIHRCTAEVHEFTGRPKVMWYRCRPPVY
ncbi:uncharacterized protein LOC123537910 isoform X2 [Mercenaria mercenaria]|uniref:uncharacterized protein LOC123537910 isoform X2 n=1 Tax=Mercenaria mercenaria TaxID=6596 RepID=UPI00234EF115|nr:uncharacterized protein LOC123537910 isoform X2 [Mercenaria mercenaria]